MGGKLGCFGYISALERTKVGAFDTKNAISLDFFEQMKDNTALEDIVLPLQIVLGDIPALTLKDQEAIGLKNGQPLSFLSKSDLERLTALGIDCKAEKETTVLALYDGVPLALVTIYGAEIRSLRVFNL